MPKKKRKFFKATEKKDIPTQKTLTPGALWVNFTENLSMKHQYYAITMREQGKGWGRITAQVVL